MVAAETILEIELDGPRNENFFFDPLNRRVRGRWDWNRVDEPQARMMTSVYPRPIPGQRLALDLATGTGYVIEPLRNPNDADAALCKERIEANGMRIGPERETFTDVHKPTWLFRMKQLVDAGFGKIVRGAFPADFGGEPRLTFLSQPPRDPTMVLAAAVEKQTAAFERLIAVLESREAKK
jgi:hypothetical protein